MKRVLMMLGLVASLATPSWAGGLGISAAYWDTDEADDETGVGMEIAFGLSPRVDLQLRGSYYKELTTDMGGREVDVRAFPLDLGLAFNFRNDSQVTPRVAAGVSHYSLSTDIDDTGVDSGNISAELGYYGGGGLDFVVYRHWAIYGDVLYRIGKARLTGEGLQGFSRRGLELSGVSANLGLKIVW